jgi:tetratricopeptide (TPR) repeat protein
MPTTAQRRSSKQSKSFIRTRSCVAIALAVGFHSAISTSGALGQYGNGEFPASPFSNRPIATPKSSEPQAVPVHDFVRQPKPSESSSRIERPAQEFRRPAQVTLMGPIVPPKASNSVEPPMDRRPLQAPRVDGAPLDGSKLNFPNEASPNEASPNEASIRGLPQSSFVHSTAAPTHALTQKTPIEAQSDWHRVQVGGQNLGLPDREEDSMQPLPSTMVATTSRASVRAADPTRFGAELVDRTNSPTSPTTPRKTAFDESTMQRDAIAERVSSELASQNPSPSTRAPERLESPPGWAAVEQELKLRLERCDSLLRRGAIHSARDEATQGMHRLCRTLDAHRPSLNSSAAFEKALTALREEVDFHNLAGNCRSDAIPSLVASHSTEALKGRPLEGVSPEIASQHYRNYARYELVVAADGHKWSSDLLYAYGKTLEKEAMLEPDRAFMLLAQSVACYQAATQVSPSRSDVASQLGYALIQLDRIDDAYQALISSIKQKPTANAWNNLAEIYRRRGAASDAQYATQQARAIANSQQKFSYENPEITEVDSATFAKYSPMQMQTSAATNAAAGATNTIQPATVKNSNVASNSLFQKIFRR